jgi:hypothetical protein
VVGYSEIIPACYLKNAGHLPWPICQNPGKVYRALEKLKNAEDYSEGRQNG